MGPSSEHAAERVFEKLEGAARRQLGLELKRLGTLPQDPVTYRSLLLGRSILEVDADASSAQSLRELSRRLTEGALSTPAG